MPDSRRRTPITRHRGTESRRRDGVAGPLRGFRHPNTLLGQTYAGLVPRTGPPAVSQTFCASVSPWREKGGCRCG